MTGPKGACYIKKNNKTSDQTATDAQLIFPYIYGKDSITPAGTQHQNDVVPTSMRRDHVAST